MKIIYSACCSFFKEYRPRKMKEEKKGFRYRCGYRNRKRYVSPSDWVGGSREEQSQLLEHSQTEQRETAAVTGRWRKRLLLFFKLDRGIWHILWNVMAYDCILKKTLSVVTFSIWIQSTGQGYSFLFVLFCFDGLLLSTIKTYLLAWALFIAIFTDSKCYFFNTYVWWDEYLFLLLYFLLFFKWCFQYAFIKRRQDSR